jgi:hypothetical protein
MCGWIWAKEEQTIVRCDSGNKLEAHFKRNNRNVRHHNWGVPSVRKLNVEAVGRRDMLSVHNFT